MISLKEATDLKFVIFNRAGEELLGYDRKALLGKNNLDLFPPEQAVHFMAKDREALAGHGVVDIPEEFIQTAKNGVRLLHTRKISIMGDDGTTKYLLGISEDITQSKKAEVRLQETLLGLRKALGGIIQVLSAVSEIRDPYTAGHQKRVSDLARAIAQELGLAPARVEGIRMAGVIHDIGKMSIPAEILSKPAVLSKIEYALIQSHVQIGHDILSEIEFAWPVAAMVLQHHERMDGSGYPQRLKGDDILLEARILAVADVIEAMSSHRPYRPALGIDAALKEIETNKGVLYDAAVVEACLTLFRDKGFKLKD
jgi:PAS domain S-box-containing protein/putative nucleotidyltransferase with HDIG domain